MTRDRRNPKTAKRSMHTQATPEEQAPPILAEAGAAGFKWFSGYIDEEFHKDLQGPDAAKMYREMQDNHPIIGVGLFVIDLFSRRVKYRVEASGETPLHLEAKELIETAVDDLNGGVSSVLSQMISALPYGWAYLEKVFKISRGYKAESKLFHSNYDDGKVRWRKIRICAQETLERWDLDDNGEVLGLEQRAAPDYRLRYIPRSKALHVRIFNKKENPEGFSILRPAYVPYHFQKHLQFIESVGIYRNVAGFPKIEVPASVMGAEDGTDEAAVRAKYINMGKKIAADEYTCVVMPSETDEDGKPTGYKFGLISSSGKTVSDTDTPIRRYRTEIATVLLVQFLLLGEKAGSYSLGETQFEMMALVIEAILDVGLTSLNDDAVPELCELNGLPADVAPTIERGKIVPGDLAKLAAFVQAMIGSGAVTPDGPLEDHLRGEADWPESDMGTARAPDMMVPEPGDAFDAAVEPVEPKTVDMLPAVKPDRNIEYLRSRDVAARWGMSPATVLKLIKEGKLQAVRLGSSIRIDMEEVVRYEQRDSDGDGTPDVIEEAEAEGEG